MGGSKSKEQEQPYQSRMPACHDGLGLKNTSNSAPIPLVSVSLNSIIQKNFCTT